MLGLGVTFSMENGCTIGPTLSTFQQTVPSFWRSLIAKRMVDQIMSISSTDGSPLHAIYQGTWVFLPLFFSLSIFFIKNLGTMYICRFDGRSFLGRFRGKRILFVGDSLSMNQWQSLTCLLHKSVPEASYTLSKVGDVSTFKFPVRLPTLISF